MTEVDQQEWWIGEAELATTVISEYWGFVATCLVDGEDRMRNVSGKVVFAVKLVGFANQAR